ncbi:hypothetical protein PJI17_23915 [Mycobacterium kansasii]
MSAARERSTCFGYSNDAGGVADFAVACLVTSATVASGEKMSSPQRQRRRLPESSL